MIDFGTTRLVGVIIGIGLVSMMGTNFAFAQQQSCGEQAYGYIGCTPLNSAQMYGAILVAGVAAFAIAWGAAGRQYHTIP